MHLFSVALLLISLQADPVTGPLNDLFEKRIEKVVERFDGFSSSINKRFDELERANESRLSEILDQLRKNNIEREGLLSEIATFRKDRDGIMSEIRNYRLERDGLIVRIQAMHLEMKESLGRWTPIQNLVDRMTALVWKIFWLVISLVVVVIVLASVGLFLYVRLKSKVFSLAKGMVT
jgi:hypothetical protein